VSEDPQASDMRASGRLPIVALVGWALFAFLLPSFVQALNLLDVLAFPLGYFIVAQGALIAFVIIGALSAWWQGRRSKQVTGA
jgi:putative solute:sodium symporter small subunit